MLRKITLSLPARASDDLLWIEPKEQALQAAARGEAIFWEFDLGLDAPYFPLEDELSFQALSLSLSTFTQELWPLFQDSTEGICLYRGSIDFSAHFTWTERQQAHWKERLQGRSDHEFLRRLFCADAFSSYFQMLSHQLPDSLPITLIFSLEGCGTLAQKFQLVSKERFEHFSVQIEEPLFSDAPSIAICFPEEARCSSTVLEKIDQMFDLLEKPIRVIQEPFLTEGWEGVDFLYVLSEAVTERGRRKLAGFCAAGGTVIVEGSPLGLSQEIGREEIRGRGIRTPGLLVPNQSR
jgi:hypothetical protein